MCCPGDMKCTKTRTVKLRPVTRFVTHWWYGSSDFAGDVTMEKIGNMVKGLGWRARSHMLGVHDIRFRGGCNWRNITLLKITFSLSLRLLLGIYPGYAPYSLRYEQAPRSLAAQISESA